MSDIPAAIDGIGKLAVAQRKRALLEYILSVGERRNIASVYDFVTDASNRVLDVGNYKIPTLTLTASGVTSQEIINVSSGEGNSTMWSFKKLYVQASLGGALLDSDDIAKLTQCMIKVNRQYGLPVFIPLAQCLNFSQIGGTPGDLTSSAVRIYECEIPYMDLLPKDTWSMELVEIPAITSSAGIALDFVLEGERVVLQN